MELFTQILVKTCHGNTFIMVWEHPVSWNVPTDILYGSEDNLTSIDTMTAFAQAHHANLTIMDGGDHWFHTDEQMKFLDNWIREKSDN